MPDKALKYALYFVLGLSLFCISQTDRSDSWQLMSCFGLAFAVYVVLVFGSARPINTKEILIVAVFLRLAVSFDFPNLSDDYIRFAFDGHVVLSGDNPYAVKPNQFVDKYGGLPKIMDHESRPGLSLNSPDYYSVYPPFSQLLFAISAWISVDSTLGFVLALRLLLLIFEVFLIVGIIQFLGKLKLSPIAVNVYAFNPLVCVEVIGNLHFEGVSLCCLVFALLLLWKRQDVAAGISWAAAISIKLIPIMFAPLLVGKVSVKRVVIVGSVCLLSVVGSSFWLFADGAIGNFGSSLELYFSTFEFNGSLYKLFREIGFWMVGWNTIATIGIISKWLLVLLAGWLVWRGRNKEMRHLFQDMLVLITSYYALASIVHPWYVIWVLVISVLNGYYFGALWSGLVVLSYINYGVESVTDLVWIGWFQYGGLYVFILGEILVKRRVIKMTYLSKPSFRLD